MPQAHLKVVWHWWCCHASALSSPFQSLGRGGLRSLVGSNRAFSLYSKGCWAELNSGIAGRRRPALSGSRAPRSIWTRYDWPSNCCDEEACSSLHSYGGRTWGERSGRLTQWPLGSHCQGSATSWSRIGCGDTWRKRRGRVAKEDHLLWNQS